MIDEVNFLDISLLGKEYRVSCPLQERDALHKAAAYLDAKMLEISKKTKSHSGERIAVMVALNIAHEHITLGEKGKKTEVETGLDFDAVKRRISAMEAQLEAVLQPLEAPQ
jgi:cell division protein ZapA